MASSLNEYLNDKFNIEPKDIRTYSPLTLAYIGDSIYDVVIRSILVNKGNTPVNKLHQRASQIVKATTQAQMILALMDELTEEEVDEMYENTAELTDEELQKVSGGTSPGCIMLSIFLTEVSLGISVTIYETVNY